MHAAADYINSVLASDPDSRPVLCEGRLDQATDVMILGHNPGLKSPPLQPFWDGEACDKAGWLHAWQHGAARKQMESKLLPCLSGLRVVECNLSHYRSKGYPKGLTSDQRVTECFQVLIEILHPTLVVIFGRFARAYFDPVQENRGKFVPATVRGTSVQVFLGDHVIMGGATGGAAFWRDGGYDQLKSGVQKIFRG